MQQLNANLLWILPLVVVVFGLLIGLSDVIRLSPYRIFAIAGVCFRESLRRRVLFVIPIAILGVMAVSAFQKPLDEQDAIRQMLKFCLFATGLLIVLTLIILACTNLPREIENRVIYTIVTKPTTRLEIILGKVVGFASVAAVVLVIMGVFTFAYLSVQSYRLGQTIQAKLDSKSLEPWQEQSLKHYQSFGLLAAKRLEAPQSGNVLLELPSAGDKVRWFPRVGDGELLIPFNVNAEALAPIFAAEENDPNQPRLVATVLFEHKVFTGPKSAATSKPFVAPFVDPANAQQTGPKVNVSIYNQYAELLADPQAAGGRDVSLVPGPDNKLVGRFVVPRAQLRPIETQKQIFLQVVQFDKEVVLGFSAKVASVEVISPSGQVLGTFQPVESKLDPTAQYAIPRGRQGRGGQQISGGSPTDSPTVAVFNYRDISLPSGNSDVGLEMNVTVERGGADDEQTAATHLQLAFTNLSNPSSPPIIVDGYPENSRTMFLTVPRAAVSGGNFDMAVKLVTPEQWVSAEASNFKVVADEKPFILNLALSLFVIWMMSLLVIIISIFCSTFLSWPIAVVLTTVILLVRWVVLQLADSLQSGIGNQISNSLGIDKSEIATTVSKSVEALTSMLRLLSNLLPDISRFEAVSYIEAGLLIPLHVLIESGAVLLVFGLPMLILSYVFLRYKEVAP